jgi:hypothetical protein
MVRNYLLRLSFHEPACLHTLLHILSKPGGPWFSYELGVMSYDLPAGRVIKPNPGSSKWDFCNPFA